MTQLIVRPLQRSDLRGLTETARGWVVEKDGKTLAVCGVIHRLPPEAFSDIEPEMVKYPKVILKLGKKLAEVCRNMGCPIYASPDKSYPRSVQFLEHLGFKRFNDEWYVMQGEG